MDQNGKLTHLAVGRSFRWVFDQLKETLGSEPDVLLTDGDLAMAPAPSSVLELCPPPLHLAGYLEG